MFVPKKELLCARKGHLLSEFESELTKFAGVSYASLRFLLPCLPKNFFKDPDHCGARKGKDQVPALWQQ